MTRNHNAFNARSVAKFGATVFSIALALGSVLPASAEGSNGSLSLGGTVEKVNTSNNDFSISTIPGGKTVMIMVPSTARILYDLAGQAPGTGPLSELKAGDTVVAMGTMTGSGFEAETIDATNLSAGAHGAAQLGSATAGSGAATVNMGGNITKVNAGAHSFTLKTDISPSVGETGKVYTVFTNSATVFASTAGKSEGFGAIRVDEHVGVVGSDSGGKYLARNIAIRLSGPNTRAGTPTTTIRSGNTTVGGSNGSLSVGTKLPAGFPKAVPLPAGSRLLAQVSTGSKLFDLWFAVNGSQTSVFNAYKAALERAHFSISSTGGIVGSAMAIISQGSAGGVTATVMPRGTVTGVPTGEVKQNQVELVLVVT